MSYDYGGGYGGGGADTGGGFNPGSQPGSQDPNAKTYGKDTLRPVTIKQLIDCSRPHPDANFIIDNTDISYITIVGQIQSVRPQATNTTYKIDDGTGLIEVKFWVNPDADPDHSKSLPGEGAYVRVYGKLKDVNGKRHVVLHIGPAAIQPVTDKNELSYHLLECAAVHLYFTRGPPDSLAGGDGKKEDGAAGDGLFVDSHGAGGGAGAGGAGEGFGQRKRMPKLSMNGNKVFRLLESAPQSNEGLHVSDIASRLQMPQAEVFKAGDELLGEGLIYPTLDDETWAVLEY